MIMSGGSKQPRCLPRCDRCFSVLFRRSSSAVVCLLVKRLSHGRKCLQPSAAGTASEHSSQTGPPSKGRIGRPGVSAKGRCCRGDESEAQRLGARGHSAECAERLARQRLKLQWPRLLHLRQRAHCGENLRGQVAVDLNQRNGVAAGRAVLIRPPHAIVSLPAHWIERGRNLLLVPSLAAVEPIRWVAATNRTSGRKRRDGSKRQKP
jgi:hypothetical protein